MPRTLSRVSRIIRLGSPAIVSICIISLQKFLFEEKVDKLYFHKPVIQTTALSLGLCLVLIVSLIRTLIFRKRRQGRVAIDSHESLPPLKKLLFAIVPGLATFFGLLFTSIGLVWLDASYLQVLGIGSVLFPTFFTIIILKNSRGILQFISLGLIVVGLALVLVAAYQHGEKDLQDDQNGKNSVIGGVLAFGGQCVTSAVPVLEDWFFGGTSTSTTLIVGLEGLFATIVAGPIFLPIVSIGNPVDGSGISEDTKGTFEMLGKSTSMVLSMLGLIALGMLHGTARAFIGPAATETGLAVALIVQTVAVWGVQIILRATLKNGSYGQNHPNVGEEWTKWSWLELVGFLIAAVGVLVNANVIKLKRIGTASGVNETPLISA